MVEQIGADAPQDYLFVTMLASYTAGRIQDLTPRARGS
jgi:hypothetical protein